MLMEGMAPLYRTTKIPEMSGLRCAFVWLDLEFSFSFNSSQSCVVFLKEAFKAAFITINSNLKAATDEELMTFSGKMPGSNDK